MKSLWLPLLLFAALQAHAADVSSKDFMKSPEDLKTWQWLTEKFGKPEEVHLKKNGELDWIGLEGESYYKCSVRLNDEGRVAQATFNNAPFSDEELHRLAGFGAMTKLTAWHNFDKLKKEENNPYSGAGLLAFKGKALESVNFGGSLFDDQGVAAAVKVPNLKELVIYHCRLSDEGLNVLAGDDHIELLQVGPQYSLRITDAALAPISQMKALKQLEFNEARLTWEGGLKHLAGLKGQIEKLVFKSGWIDDADLAKLKEALPGVEIEYTRAEDKFIEQMQRRIEKNQKS